METSSSGGGCRTTPRLQSMPRGVPKAMVLVGFVAAIATILFVSSSPTIGYLRFRFRNQGYHAKVAEACDKVLLAHAVDAPYKISGSNLQTLPPILREIGSSFVTIDTNCVSLLVGGGFDAYHILWMQDGSDKSLWRLLINRNGTNSHVVFSTRKPTQ